MHLFVKNFEYLPMTHSASVNYLVAQVAVVVGPAFELAKGPPAGLLLRLGAKEGVGTDAQKPFF